MLDILTGWVIYVFALSVNSEKLCDACIVPLIYICNSLPVFWHITWFHDDDTSADEDIKPFWSNPVPKSNLIWLLPLNCILNGYCCDVELDTLPSINWSLFVLFVPDIKNDIA